MALGTSRSANMSSGLLLQDPLPSPTAEPAPNGVTRFRPYASPDHHVTKARYITSNDPRGYIPVYEYPLNGQWIMLDMDDGYVLWTGIWKALGNSKADIVKIIDSQPDLAAQLRRVRGGYLKIQGTWMPYEIALRLSRRVAWPIRHDLVPLFGPSFPETCLPPDSPGYGQIAKPGTGKRRARRNPPAEVPLSLNSGAGAEWSVSVGDAGPPTMNGGTVSTRSTLVMSHTFAAQPGRHIDTTFSTHHQQLAPAYPHIGQQSDSPVMLHVPYVERPHAANSPTSSTSTSSSFFHSSGASRRHSPPVEPGSSRQRYSPYPSPLSSTTSRFSVSSAHSAQSPGGAESSMSISPTSSRPLGETIKLPPIQPPSRRASGDGAGGTFHLPPISSMDNLREAQCGEPMAVLRRLQSSDEDGYEQRRDDVRRIASVDSLTQRRHSLAVADALHAYKS
ncbi:hypothetical protein L226DRAFT_263895 [Lentinus tigrinus ALCF2SS1-7]|uniref:HTH APSES-type domain-containing protein n=1 Tax=Lentinus tigrinus ALCF2SS1-6 TaxID=1328759 RepID=A0A5C2RUX8_9APHY|nr:hypothetical protein L227DRAFT_337753 [Lentinus tigrinus ALCF2SS1-6]RPD69955.1 hypothetical protein L226DRAFT_263895 [Lentinus tigrinus ALCF2SS1-7]